MAAPVVVRVSALAPEVIRDELSARVRVAPVAGWVRVTLLIDVAVAAPRTGVVREGEEARTMLPVPVTVLPRAVTVPEVGRVREVAPVVVKNRVLAVVASGIVPELSWRV